MALYSAASHQGNMYRPELSTARYLGSEELSFQISEDEMLQTKNVGRSLV